MKRSVLLWYASGREIQPDYPCQGLDIEPKIDEFRIVGPTGGGVDLTIGLVMYDSGATEIITVTLTEQSQVLRLMVLPGKWNHRY